MIRAFGPFKMGVPECLNYFTILSRRNIVLLGLLEMLRLKKAGGSMAIVSYPNQELKWTSRRGVQTIFLRTRVPISTMRLLSSMVSINRSGVR